MWPLLTWRANNLGLDPQHMTCDLVCKTLSAKYARVFLAEREQALTRPDAAFSPKTGQAMYEMY